MLILDNIPIFGVVLNKRLKQWHEISEQFKNLGLRAHGLLVGTPNDGEDQGNYFHIDVNSKPPIYLNTNMYPSWTDKTNAYDAFLSHNKILQYAMQENFPYIMIVEDDIKIEENFITVMSEIDDYFFSRPFDILQLGGYNHKNNMTQITDNIWKTKGSGGWHAVILKQNVIRHLSSFKPIGPYDWICEQYIQPYYNCYVVHPGIINQRDGYSYVEGCNLTKPDKNIIGE